VNVLASQAITDSTTPYNCNHSGGDDQTPSEGWIRTKREVAASSPDFPVVDRSVLLLGPLLSKHIDSVLTRMCVNMVWIIEEPRADS
jgi:hypothetical protein